VISLLVGYFIFGLVMLAIIALMTAFYVWRGRSIASKWWKKAERANDSAPKEPK
jgi:hypothetical protein